MDFALVLGSLVALMDLVMVGSKASDSVMEMASTRGLELEFLLLDISLGSGRA